MGGPAYGFGHLVLADTHGRGLVLLVLVLLVILWEWVVLLVLSLVSEYEDKLTLPLCSSFSTMYRSIKGRGMFCFDGLKATMIKKICLPH